MNITSILVGVVISTASVAGVPEHSPRSPSPRVFEVAQPVGGEARELSVLTYNIKGLPWPVASGRAAALRSIGRQLAELRRQGRAPDVVLIQEGFEDVSDLVRLSGYRYWAAGPQRGDRAPKTRSRFARARWLLSGEGWGKFTSGGLHVLSDLPVTRVEAEPYFYCAGFDCLANKGAMLVRLDVPGLPAPLEIVNTHMNSRGAAKVPSARSQRAHNLQSDELLRFIGAARTPGAALLVGGDFNVKRAPGRYYYRSEERPFVVVSEFCKARPQGCASALPLQGDEPWLDSQDLQAFATEGRVAVRPIAIAPLFAGGETGPRLSDHDGVLVLYRLSWTPASEPRREVAVGGESGGQEHAWRRSPPSSP